MEETCFIFIFLKEVTDVLHHKGPTRPTLITNAEVYSMVGVSYMHTAAQRPSKGLSALKLVNEKGLELCSVSCGFLPFSPPPPHLSKTLPQL
jgi:hypothetical protein